MPSDVKEGKRAGGFENTDKLAAQAIMCLVSALTEETPPFPSLSRTNFTLQLCMTSNPRDGRHTLMIGFVSWQPVQDQHTAL